MKLPQIIFQRECYDGYSHTTYRMVATEQPFMFTGVGFYTEKLAGMDAMGNEIWQQTESTELSMVMNAIGEHLHELAVLAPKCAEAPSK